MPIAGPFALFPGYQNAAAVYLSPNRSTGYLAGMNSAPNGNLPIASLARYGAFNRNLILPSTLSAFPIIIGKLRGMVAYDNIIRIQISGQHFIWPYGNNTGIT